MIFVTENVRKSILCASEPTKVIFIFILRSCQNSRFSDDNQKSSFLLTLNMRPIEHHTSGTQMQVIQFKSCGFGAQKKFKTTSSSFNNICFGLKLIAYPQFAFFSGFIRQFSAFGTQNFCKINKNLRTRRKQNLSEVHLYVPPSLQQLSAVCTE